MNPGSYYHIYNRAINKEQLFIESKNYDYFLKQFSKYLSAYVDVFAYCLLPNHFHFFIRVKEIEVIPSSNKLTMVEKAFRDFFISYAMSINKKYGRTGSLFQHKFKRKEVANTNYYTRLIYYIHLNPVAAGLSSDFAGWRWSSYESLISDKDTLLCRQEVMDWFGGRVHFIKCHEMNLLKE